MSTPADLEKAFIIPPDLTGEVEYEKVDRVESRGGHAHVYQGTWTPSTATAILVCSFLT